jgi:ABC-type transport system substrate-binding protein
MDNRAKGQQEDGAELPQPERPVIYALNLFASYGSFSGDVLIAPRETDTTFGVRTTMLGTGPSYRSSYQPSVALILKRHPECWDSNFNLADEINYAMVPDPGGAPGAAQGR